MIQTLTYSLVSDAGFIQFNGLDIDLMVILVEMTKSDGHNYFKLD